MKLQKELEKKNNELERFQSSMNHEKTNLTAKQEKLIDQWKEKYEKVILFLNLFNLNNLIILPFKSKTRGCVII